MMDLPHQDYVVEPILPTGLYLLAGSPKIGKSWFVLQLGIAVSNGQSFLGFKSHASSVLYLCLEDTYQRIRNRLMDYEEEYLDHIDFVLESQSLDYGLINDLKYHLETKPDTKLIIIDTLQKIRNNRSDGYAYGQDYKDINVLNKFVNETGITVILVHHLRKMKAEDSFEEISGTTGLTGAVDGMFVMKKLSNRSQEATLIATGRDIESFELKLSFNNSIHRFELLEKSLEDEVEDNCIINVIKLIHELKYFEGTASELSELLGTSVTPSALSKKLRRYENVLRDHQVLYRYTRTSYQKTITLTLDDGSDGNDWTIPPENLLSYPS